MKSNKRKSTTDNTKANQMIVSRLQTQNKYKTHINKNAQKYQMKSND